MAFTAADVKNLREKTGCGMMDCKKALTESGGDMDKAIEFLREKGLAAAEKKAGRIAAEGLVVSVVSGKVGVVLEVNAETDFVAKNETFVEFVNNVAMTIIKNNPADVEELSGMKCEGTEMTVAEALNDRILVIGENMKIRRFVRMEGDLVPYVHGGGKIGVVVRMEVSDNIKDNETVVELGRDIGMQIAALNPQWLNRESVPAEKVEAEKEILRVQTINEGKPAAVADKIVAGRINKFYEENCLVDQAFVKENKISVAKHIEAVAKELGGTIALTGFVRYARGEGIAKREDNFAEEVAKMTGK